MRSSKSRSRSKQNRPRTIGNIVNRVFDSSGPEGKVRGTPQQIIEKYQALARDAQLSNDRVAAENFLQHAEHYTRMLGEAMREMAADQEARRQFQNTAGGNGGQNDRQGYQRRDDREDRGDERAEDGQQPDFGAVPMMPFDDQPLQALDVQDGGLVETPEARSEQPAQEPRGKDPRRDDRRGGGGHNRRAPRNDSGRGDNPRDSGRGEPRGDYARGENTRNDQPRNDSYRTEQPRVEPVRAEQPSFEEPRPEPVRAESPVADKPVTERPKRVSQPRREEPAAVAVISTEAASVDAPEAPKPRRPRAPRKPAADGAAPKGSGATNNEAAE